MVYDYELSRKNLENLVVNTKEDSRNEATTRLHIIDRLFFDCLGWLYEDVKSEVARNNEYADYTFYAPRQMLIVEAKREGNYFDIPIDKNRIEYSLPSLIKDLPNLKDAIEQAAGYCQSRGVPFGAVCNGHQLVLFIANRSDGTPPLDGKALVFPSLQFMLDHFGRLWNVLSRQAVEEKNLQTELVGSVLPTSLPKLSQGIMPYPGSKNRNPFQTDLQIVSDIVITDVTPTPEAETNFLQQCYCRSGSLSQHALVCKAILETKYAALFDDEISNPTTMAAVEKKGVSPELVAGSLTNEPILLIGDVGVGKTTFIRHLILVEAKQLFENALTFYIDFGSQATLSPDIKLYVLNEISSQLRDNYNIDIESNDFVKGVYFPEIQRFSKGIYADLKKTNPSEYHSKQIHMIEGNLEDVGEHLRRAVEHLSKGQKKQVIVFLDNADQRSDDTQQAVFLIAQEIAKRWKATVYVTLRPETFIKSRSTGAISGYYPKAFTISPPRIDRVVEQRLEFALKLCQGEIKIASLPTGIGVKFTTLADIITIFMSSLVRNGSIGEFIDNISGGNVRRALGMLRIFFGSGHTATEKMLDKYRTGGSYYVPLHEFLRAIIYGDTEYYSPDTSIIANLFDLSRDDPREHYLLPIALGILIAAINNPINLDKFVETNTLYDQLQSLGFAPDQFDLALIRGFRKNLLETSARREPKAGQQMPRSFRITSVGAYHVQRLVGQFTYMDAILVDTPILEGDFRKHLSNVMGIKERLQRCEIFRKYLDQQWNGLKSTLQATENEKLNLLFNWDIVSEELRKDINQIQVKLADT